MGLYNTDLDAPLEVYDLDALAAVSADAPALDLYLPDYENDPDKNGLDDTHVGALARFSALTTLRLGAAKGLSDAGLGALASTCPGLTDLTLRNAPQITTKGLRALKRLGDLRALGLWGAERVGSLKPLQALPLTELTIRTCKKLGASALVGLGGLASLERLSLVSQKVSRATMQAIASLPALRELSFVSCEIAPGAFEGLAGAPALARLSPGRALGDAEIAAVAGLPSLEAVYLVALDEASVRAMAPLSGRDLRLSLVFQELDQTTDSALQLVAATLPDLKELNLHQGQVVNRGNKFGADGLLAVAGLRQLERLDLYRGGAFKNDAMAPFAGHPALERLNLHSCYKLTSGVMKHIGQIPNLTHLNLSGIKVSDASLKKLVGLPLRVLSIHDAKISDKGIQNLAKIPTLQKLSVTYYLKEITDVGVTALSQLPELQLLRIELTQVTGASFEALGQMPALAWLSLRTRSAVQDDWIASLASAPGLRRLDFDIYTNANALTDRALAALAARPSMQLFSARAGFSDAARARATAQGLRFDPTGNRSFNFYVGGGVWDREWGR